jgi:HK97 family phage prohead protease
MDGRFELRRQRRMAMRGVPERLGLRFADGHIEMRSKPNGTAAGVNFEWRGYATVYGAEFDMWDQNGDPFTEDVAQGAARRSLANPNLDVPFLIGHNDAGIPLARTKSGTMRLAEDSHGVFTHVPSMDGRREEVRALASAVERGDLDEMSLAFVCLRQQWDAAYEHRTVLEMDLHRGDVCAVTHGANPATAGASMTSVEQLAFRRPAAIGGPVLLGRERRMPTQPYGRGADEHVTCPQCQSGNDADANACDQCGCGLRASMPYFPDPDDSQQCPWCQLWNAADAKVCDQCGRGLTFDRDEDDPGYSPMMDWSDGRLRERRAAMATASINDLPDSAFAWIEPGGSKDAEGKTTPRSLRHFPVHDAAHVRNALARAPQSPFGEEAMPKIREAAKRFGVEVSGQEPRAAGRPLARRASAAEDTDLAAAADYNAAAAAHDPVTGIHTHDHGDGEGGGHSHPHMHDGDAAHGHTHSGGTDARVVVDDSTGIPGEETQLSAARKLQMMARALELEELAAVTPRAARRVSSELAGRGYPGVQAGEERPCPLST